MSQAEDRLRMDRENRNAAKSVFVARLGQVKSDLSARGVGARIVDKAKGDARAALDETVEVARDSKGIIAATAGALAFWFLRDKLQAWVSPLLHREEVTGDE